MAYRLAVSRWRHHTAGLRAFMRHGAVEELPPPSADTIAVRDALAELPKGLRAALVLFYFGGMQITEVADALDVAPGTVKSRLSRGRAAMAALLTDTTEFGDEAVEVAHAW